MKECTRKRQGISEWLSSQVNECFSTARAIGRVRVFGVGEHIA